MLFWANIPEDLKILLLGAGGELTASAFEYVISKTLSINKDTPEAIALKKSYSEAGSAFLSCFEYPAQADLHNIWLLHVKNLSDKVFSDDLVKDNIANIVLYGNSKETDLLIAFQNSWASNYGAGGELSLPFKKDLVLADAIHAFIEAFEQNVESQPTLHTFLLASRLKKIVNHLEDGVKVIGIDTLADSLKSISNQQSRIVELLSQLASWGISIGKDGTITGTKGISVKDNFGENEIVKLAQKLRLSLEASPENEVAAIILEYRAKIKRNVHFMPLGSLAISGFNSVAFNTRVFNVPFEDVFVDLHAIYIDDKKENEDKYSFDLSKMIKDKSHNKGENIQSRLAENIADDSEKIFFVGRAGSGKSILLHRITHKYASSGERLPLLIPLSQIDILMDNGLSFIDAALDLLTLHNTGSEREKLRNAIWGEIKKKKVIWLLDGLDEVRHHTNLIFDALNSLGLDGQKVIVTSRPLGLKFIFIGFKYCEILPLKQNSISSFLLKWLVAVSRFQKTPQPNKMKWINQTVDWINKQFWKNYSLNELSENPLMLSFIAILASSEFKQNLPSTIIEIIDLFFDRLFAKWETYPQGRQKFLPDLEFFEARELFLWGLQVIALYVISDESHENKTFQSIKQYLTENLTAEYGGNKFKSAAKAEQIILFWEDMGFLERLKFDGDEWIVFQQVFFMEYSAALALVEKYKHDIQELWDVFSLHLYDVYWENTISFTVALLKNGDLLIEKLLEENNNDISYQRPLLLAANALVEKASISQKTKSKIFDSLEKFMKLNSEIIRNSKVVPQTRLSQNEKIIKIVARLDEEAILVKLGLDTKVDYLTRLKIADILIFLKNKTDVTAIIINISSLTERYTWNGTAARYLMKLGSAANLVTWMLVKELDPLEEFDDDDPFDVNIDLISGYEEDAVDILVSVAQVSGFSGITASAIKALRKMNQLSALQLLISKVSNPTLVAVAEGLEDLGDLEGATNIWVKLAFDSNISYTIRSLAVDGLGRCFRYYPSLIRTKLEELIMNSESKKEKYLTQHAKEILDRLR